MVSICLFNIDFCIFFLVVLVEEIIFTIVLFFCISHIYIIVSLWCTTHKRCRITRVCLCGNWTSWDRKRAAILGRVTDQHVRLWSGRQINFHTCNSHIAYTRYKIHEQGTFTQYFTRLQPKYGHRSVYQHAILFKRSYSEEYGTIFGNCFD